jgi:hypothetical protein
MALVLSTGVAWATHVSWIPGETTPAAWTVSAKTADVMTFSGRTNVYANRCLAEAALGGTPTIYTDPATKVVELWFLPPAPIYCEWTWEPVCGLQGEFGPLAAGQWTFLCRTAGVQFEVPFTVGGGRVVYVDADAFGTPDGTSWSTAFRTLQDGLAAASAGDEVRVAQGRYQPDQGAGRTPGDREASFALVSGVIVKGGHAGYGQPQPDSRDFERYASVLSGDLKGNDLGASVGRADNSFHVVTASGIAPSATLDGFTIVAGQADGHHFQRYGGGVFLQTGSPVIVNCQIRDNTAAIGGGLACLGAAPAIANCRISGNRALVFGGGLHNEESVTELTNCLLTGNSSDTANLTGGSALCNLGGTLAATNCTIADNGAAVGRAIISFVWDPSYPGTITIHNSILHNGGNEIWSNSPWMVTVSSSNVQGGHAGPGNLNADPRFISRGTVSIEGQWVEGDYRLDASSPCLNKGNASLLPMDLLDLDGDSDTNELLPVDLDGADRIRGTAVDQGAYERQDTLGPPAILW